ncbi:uncharacterized protein BYT42DRAFT_566631 [Radiomyces spectabilis]|uniref:uncharacterized protein n=1 Tax=Radiomyces spectabilis TaxID=64574 RepID=UPI0022201094|nr:uncharacterized protein BYT42DRAFT_566631 [Radiomyces spectabilis]KAI8381468.1 hypothetical protein BYT42DRAFT_566631 [Radiomyces spectabilis]
MKSVHCIFNHGRFDDQYTLELDGFISQQEYFATMNSFNNVARRHRPPPSLQSGVSTGLIVCIGTTMISAVIVAMRYQQPMPLVMSLPLLLLLLSVTIVAWRRRQKAKFECAILHLCSCMNATENVRGINYRLSKLPPEQCVSLPMSVPQTLTRSGYSYAITIEFDDRYNLLHHFANNSNNNHPLKGFQPSNHLLPSYSLPSTSPPSYPQSHVYPQWPAHAYQPDEKI